MSSIELTNRTLYSDGDSVVPVDKLLALLSTGGNSSEIFVNETCENIIQFNKFVPKEEQITVKLSTRENDTSWDIPQEYAEIDPASYVIQTFVDMLAEDRKSGTHKQCKEKRMRVIQELKLYEDLGLMPVLSVLIYIINTLRKNDVVWGVGRGSSVSSYVLYVIGVHDVDSVEYDLDIHDFLRVKGE